MIRAQQGFSQPCAKLVLVEIKIKNFTQWTHRISIMLAVYNQVHPLLEGHDLGPGGPLKLRLTLKGLTLEVLC